MFFSGLGSDSPELQHLKRLQQTNGARVQSSQSFSPWIPITTNWEEFSSRISSKWRSTFRRSERRAEEFGPLQFEVISPNCETLEQYLPEIFQVEAAGWKSRTGTSLQSHPMLSSFFREYTKATSRLGMLRLALLRVGGKAIAVQLMVECENRLWILKVGYDEAYARCSPGVLLMSKVIQYAVEKKYDAVELLGASEPWIEVWRPNHHIHETYRNYPASPMAVVSHGLEISSTTYKKFRTIVTKKGPKAVWSILVKKFSSGTNSSQTQSHE